MVDAYIDSYLQTRITFSQEDLDVLERRGKMFCRIERSSRDAPRKKFPLWIYLCKDDRPEEDELGPWREDGKQKYEIYVSRRRVKAIRDGKMVGADPPRVWLRCSWLSLEGVTQV